MAINLVLRVSPNVITHPRKAPARSIHSSTEEQHCGFSQTVTHPNTNAAICCLTSIVSFPLVAGQTLFSYTKITCFLFVIELLQYATIYSKQGDLFTPLQG